MRREREHLLDIMEAIERIEKYAGKARRPDGLIKRKAATGFRAPGQEDSSYSRTDG